MKSDKSITITDASIKQVSIEVKVIKIDNKQMTLAVFRQLPEKPILDVLTGELTGTPWGRVNYCPDCKNTFPHFHVVWQKGNELCRTTIENRWMSGPSENIREELLFGGSNPLSALNYSVESYICTRSLQGWLPDDPPLRKRGSHYIYYTYVLIEGYHYMLEFDTLSTHIENLWKAIRTRIEKKEALMSWEERAQDNPYVAYYQKTVNEWREYYAQSEKAYQDCCKQSLNILTEHGLPQDPDRLYRDYLLPAYREYLAYVEQWKASYAQLEALDQLFIAV